MRPLTAMLVLFSLALAGCSSNDPQAPDPEEPDDEDDVDTTPPSPPPTPPAPPPAPPAPPKNRAPVASLTASAEEGALPLLVNFTVDGSDADGDGLSWSLDADGDGEADAEGQGVPADASHTYGEAGLYSATLTVSDGEDEDSAVLLVNVTEAAPEGLLLSGAVDGPCEACSSGPIVAADPTGMVPGDAGVASPLFCQSFVTGDPGTDCIWFEVTEDMKGKAFTATSTGGDPDMVFTNTCAFPADPEAEEPEPYDPDPEANHFFFVAGPEAGTVPADSDCVILWEYDATGAQTIELRIV